jgi:hypothetical protein
VTTAADPSAGPGRQNDILGTAQAALSSTKAAQAYVDYMNGAGTFTPGEAEVLAYVTTHAPNARIQLAVELGSWGADPFLVNSSARVAAFGGYIGLDPSPTAAQVAGWAGSRQLGFVLLPAPLLKISKLMATESPRKAKAVSAATAADTATLDTRITWVTHHCAPVRPAAIGPDAADAGFLFQCG